MTCDGLLDLTIPVESYKEMPQDMALSGFELGYVLDPFKWEEIARNERKVMVFPWSFASQANNLYSLSKII